MCKYTKERVVNSSQVTVAVVTKTVTVRHSPAEISPGALVAALNAVHLDASLTSARKQGVVKRSWLPPWNIVLAAVLLLISCVHYLAGPTGACQSAGCEGCRV